MNNLNIKGYRPDIDGLRAIAILAVVIFHAGVPLFEGGFIGVDIFFVISGYLIGAHVLNEVNAGTFTFASFYGRRIKRIVPAFLLMLLVSFIIALFVLAPHEMKKFAASAASTLFGASNIFFWLKTDYFSAHASQNPLLMTWSLSVEEQFYFLFPISIVLIQKWLPKALNFSMLAFTLVSLILSIVMVYKDPASTFYLLPTRGWEIGAGVLLVIFERDFRNKVTLKQLHHEIMAVVGMVMICVGIVTYRESMAFPGIAAVLPVVGAVLLIASPSSFINRYVLASKPFVGIGLVSYSWYLWHWPLLSFMSVSSDIPLSPVTGVLVVILALGIAYLSYRFVETPFRKSAPPKTKIFYGYATAATLFMLPVGAALAFNGIAARVPQTMVRDDKLVTALSRNPCLVTDKVVTPNKDEFCLPRDGKRGVALIGDSHAAALSAAMRTDAAAKHYNLHVLTKASCPALYGVSRVENGHPGHEQECAKYNSEVIRYIMDNPTITDVVIAGFWSAPLSSENPNSRYISLTQSPAMAVSGLDLLKAGLVEQVNQLQKAGKKVYVMQDVPSYQFNPVQRAYSTYLPFRAALADMNVGARSEAKDGKSAHIVLDPTREAVASVAGTGDVQIIDPWNVLCKEGKCTYLQPEGLLYVDRHHLSSLGAGEIVQQLGFKHGE